jgi:ABC-2 type transport system permease protein
MIRQIKLLTHLQLLVFFNVNEARYSQDKRKRKRAAALLWTFAVLGVLLMFYAGALSYAYVALNMAEIIPTYLFTAVSLILFLFTMLKSGEMVFNLKDYEKTIVLPVTVPVLVISRFLSVYLVNLLLSALVLLPGTAVYVWFVRPDALFYILSVIGLLLTPLLPMAVATLLGALILSIASRMRRKNLVSLVLYLLLTLGILFSSLSVSSTMGSMSDMQLAAYASTLLQALATIYPVSVWYTAGLGGNLGAFAGFAALSVGVFAAYIWLVQRVYPTVCSALTASFAHRRYQMGALVQASPLHALYRKELKRYFASPIYVMNTCIGGVLLVLLGAAAVIAGPEQLQTFLGQSGILTQFIPLLLGFMCAISPTTSSAISMEGRQWWIVQSLPVSTRTVLNSKILVNLTVMLPCCVVAWILLLLALPMTALDALFVLLVPVCCTLFMSVAGLAVNLKMPIFNWESETTVVKQSGAALVGTLTGCGIMAICAVLIYAAPTQYKLLYAGICVLLLGSSCLLYRKIEKISLADIA